MQVQILRGNPLAIILVSVVFTAITVIIAVVTFFNNKELPPVIMIFIIFILVYNLLAEIAFYLVYRHEKNNTKYSFMSPKKYKKTTQLNEKYKSDNQRLKNALVKIDKSYEYISEDDAIAKAIELLTDKLIDNVQNS